MKVSEFDFDLPKKKIATRPIEPRDSAKMLCIDGKNLQDKVFSDILDEINVGDCLVLNDTKVIPVRIRGLRDKVNTEVTLHKMYNEDSWWAFASYGKRLKTGDVINFDKEPSTKIKDFDSSTREELKEFARQNRGKMTYEEFEIWKYINKKQLGYEFRRQFIIANKYIVDFICLEKNLVVEIDGSQHSDNEKDKERDAYLESQGFKVLRFWNNEVRENIEGCYEIIKKTLSSTPTLWRGRNSIAISGEGLESSLNAAVIQKDANLGVLLQFNKSGDDLIKALKENGEMPLPPYIERLNGSDSQDVADYQTVFAKNDGAVAAPTAGLHFTEELLEKIKEKGIEIVYITLHVGAGTFMPVKVEDTDNHIMHSEYGIITQEQADKLNKIHKNGGNIIAVGTTSLRLLESATGNDGIIKSFADETDIFITPGYEFKAVDKLITNFHLPLSTLFMLVCAFAGTDNMKNAYEHAKNNDYRFYSYGDACFLGKSI